MDENERNAFFGTDDAAGSNSAAETQTTGEPAADCLSDNSTASAADTLSSSDATEVTSSAASYGESTTNTSSYGTTSPTSPYGASTPNTSSYGATSPTSSYGASTTNTSNYGTTSQTSPYGASTPNTSNYGTTNPTSPYGGNSVYGSQQNTRYGTPPPVPPYGGTPQYGQPMMQQAYPPPPYPQQPFYGAPYGRQMMPPPPPPVLPPAPQEDAPVVPISKPLKLVALVVAIVLLLFSVFCIVWDVKRGTSSGGYVAGEIHNVSIGTQKKPEVDSAYQDENGRYTVEGIAVAVRPSIVEIYTYADKMNVSALGSGSGIIMSEDGYIVTNTHVLEGAASYLVYLSDGNSYSASLVGRDAKTDIAVLKVDKSDLTPAVLGDSDEVELGEEVVAIGNPAGLSGTLTNGIVSGLNRKIRTESTGYQMTCIQTNAAISPGNSGGALVNMYGQVIGITSSKYVSSSYEGLGFAITINEAIPIIEELISQGHIGGRFRIGISFYGVKTPYTQAMFAEEYNMELPDDFDGIWIGEIDESCDIAKSKLKKGDFIVSVDGKAVTDYDTLFAAIGNKKAGDTLQAKCVRIEKTTGKQTEFTITFALMEDTSGDF